MAVKKMEKKVVKKVVPKSMSKEKMGIGLVQKKKVLTAEGYKRRFLTKSKKSS